MVDMARRIDSIGTIRKAHRTPEGYLYAEATISRTGVLPYLQPDGSVRRELRPRDEVEKSLANIARKPVTLGHPTVNVTPDNIGELGVGLLDWKVELGLDGWVQAGVQVTRRDALDAIESGTTQMSGGLDINLDMTPGWWDPVEQSYYLDGDKPPASITDRLDRFDAIQRDLDHNHFSIVDDARAGSEAHMRLDSDDAIMTTTEPGRVPGSAPEHSGGRTMPQMDFDGVAYEVPENLVGPITAMRDSGREAITAAESTATTATEQLTAAQAATADVQTKLDTAQGTLAGLESSRADAVDEFPARFQSRLDALVTAKALRLDEGAAPISLTDATTDVLKRAVVASKYPDITLEGRSDDYVEALYSTVSTPDPTAHAGDIAAVLRGPDGLPAPAAGAGEDRAALNAAFLKGLRG